MMNKAFSQNINGILLLNKPSGLTSNAVLQRVKRLYCAKKAGHTGSLDPIATGMLPICFGEATKFSQFLLEADKCYKVTARLGMKTNTGDYTGETTAYKKTIKVSQTELENVLATYIGSISQTPSMFSALKYQGTPLYKLARAGLHVERPPRIITIHELTLNEYDGLLFNMTVKCSKGTYIRNLVEDVGDDLGVGAHVTQLHRCYTAGFSFENMVSIDSLFEMTLTERNDSLFPLERAVSQFPVIELDSDEIMFLRQGKTLFRTNLAASYVRLYDSVQGQFIGVGEVFSSGLLKVKRLLAY